MNTAPGLKVGNQAGAIRPGYGTDLTLPIDLFAAVFRPRGAETQ